MRILWFVIAAAAMHSGLLGVSLDNSRERIDEFLVGVVLVERQLDFFAADAAAGSIAHPVPDQADQVNVAEGQEQRDRPTMQKLTAEVDDSTPRQDIELPVVVKNKPTKTIHQTQLLPEPVNHSSPKEIAPSAPREATPVSSTAVSPSQLPPLRQGSMSSAEPVVGAAVQTAVALQLSAQPRYGYHPAPSYPRLARDRGWEGTVEFMVRVLATGEVAEVLIKNSSGYKSLDDAAHRAIIRWRFTPAKSSGQVVESWVVVPVHFVLDNQAQSR
jgi:TonB family protein